ncbi:MAG: molybdopterin molybdotransferase MoeA [Flavobacteriales bacterium]|nr:molybdopterin molybdotransferase MoeA [Flavobacteriales bacterium]
MIDVQQARAILMQQVRVLPTEVVPLSDAVGRFLGADVRASDAFPRFDMSAVDGYAVGAGPGPWRRIGAVAAGEVLPHPVGADECARIFTGAQVPVGAMAVVMQERCTEKDGLMRVTGEAPHAGAHIRRKAEGYRTGDRLLRAGDRLDPAAIGLLASSGIRSVAVTRRPRVAVIRTGAEFITEGGAAEGRIHSSNELMLQAALQEVGVSLTVPPLVVDDDADRLSGTLRSACATADLVLTTGGASVGEHDLLRPVLEREGGTIMFHGVRQKPGKPMLFATLGGTPLIGLPGNPRAVLVLFMVYVRSVLRALQGARDPGPDVDLLPLAAPLERKGERDEFRAARVTDGRVELLPDEGSHLLGGLIGDTVLCHLEAAQARLDAGVRVRVIRPLP